MLPHNHFAISGLTIAAVTYAAYPEKSIMDISKWALFGGILSAAVDLDVVILVYLKSQKDRRLRRFRNIVNIFRDFNGFKDVMAETGVLKTGMISHIILSAVLVVFFYLFSGDFFIPALLGITTHLITDVPNYRRLILKN
jgi:hypothetical protein